MALNLDPMESLQGEEEEAKSQPDIAVDEYMTNTESVMSVIFFKNDTAQLKWHTLESELLFSVSYINIPEYVAQTYMNRYNEEAYKIACEEKREFNLPLFPPDASVLKHFPHLIDMHEEVGLAITPSNGVSFREEFLHLSQLVKAVRVRRIVLLDKYITLKNKIRRYDDFLQLCQEKMVAHLRRQSMLENELLLFEPFDSFQSSTLFGSFLSTSTGWSTALSYLVKEFKYVQQKEAEATEEDQEKEDDMGEGVMLESVLRRQGLGLNRGEIDKAWQMIKFWQVIHSAAARAYLGAVGSAQYKAHSIPKKSATADLVVKQKNFKKKPSRGLPVAILGESVGDADDAPTQPQPSISRRSSSRVMSPQRSNVGNGSFGGEGAGCTSFNRRSSSRVLSPQQSSCVDTTEDPAGGGQATADLANHIQPMLPCGLAGIASWDALCAFLNVDPPASYTGKSANQTQSELDLDEVKSIVLIATGITEMIASNGGISSQLHSMVGNFVIPYISKVSVSTLAYTVKEEIAPSVANAGRVSVPFMPPNDEALKALGIALLAVADDIARELESFLLEPFRRLAVWTSMLEGMRRERVKREGGKMSMRDDAEVEMDEQGAIRVIPNADEIVDTDVLHGSKQRVRIQVAIPQAQNSLKVMMTSRFNLEGEIACVAQLGFQTAVPYVQRAFRGCIIRHRKENFLRKDLVLFAMHAAACTIQSAERARVGRERFREFARLRRNECATTIQRYVRGYLGRSTATAFSNDVIFKLETLGATAMQRIVRGFLGRRIVCDILQNAADEKLKDNKAWAIMILQKVARGYIARNSIVRSRHIRNNLSPEVLKLAERYMCDTRGDLWGFLKEVDETLKRYSKNIEESQAREDEWADTFVNKVVAMREKNFDGAWTDFASVQGQKLPTMGPDPAVASPNKRTQLSTSAVGEVAFQDSMLSILMDETSPQLLQDTNKSLNRSWNGITAPNPPPGPLLRRAVSSTMKRTRNPQKKVDPEKASRMKHVTATYGKTMKPRKQVNTSSRAMKPAPGDTKKKSSVFSSSSKFKEETNMTSKISQAFLKDEWIMDSALAEAVLSPKKGNSGSLSPIRLGSMESVKGDNSAGRPYLIHKHGKTDPGISLLVDIPLGINDKLERLINAAGMRCYVPEIFTRSRSLEGSPPISHAEAYSMYQTLPPNCLAKIRYEQKVQQWCMPSVNKLRLKGFNYIKEALPASKLGMFLRSIETPSLLIRHVLEILNKLLSMDLVPDGFMREEMKGEYERITRGEATIKRTLNAAAAGRAETSQERQIYETGEEEFVRLAEVNRAEQDRLKENAQRLVEKMISKGPWAKLDAPVDVLLQNAAFLVVPFDRDGQYHAEDEPDSRGIMTLEGLFGNEKETTEELRMGQLAFTKFANHLVRCLSDDAMKIAIRDRYRAAVILSTPYELRLKQIGVMFVRDLCTLKGQHGRSYAAVSEVLKSMPKPFLHQVEALCSMAISVTSDSRFYATCNEKASEPPRSAVSAHSFAKLKTTLPGPLSQNPRLIQVPLAFDSKFQRGPLDPYGRPPRLTGQLPALRQPSQDSQRSRSLPANKGSVMPELGEESAATLTIQEAAKRQSQIAVELEASGQYVSVDMKEMYGSIPHNLWELDAKETHEVKGVSISDQSIAAADPSVDMWAFEPSHRHRPDEMHDHSTDSLPSNSLNEYASSQSGVRLERPIQSSEDRQTDAALSTSAQPPQGVIGHKGASRQSRKSTRGSSSRRSANTQSAFDTETKFERPHKCSFDGCNQSFARVYTLKLHEKSHLMFPEYHKFRHDPHLALDADFERMIEESRQNLMTRQNLPLLRDLELERTLIMSAQGIASDDW